MSSTRMTLPTLSGKPRVIDGAPKSASPRRDITAARAARLSRRDG
jgi:hypothetical protein